MRNLIQLIAHHFRLFLFLILSIGMSQAHADQPCGLQGTVSERIADCNYSKCVQQIGSKLVIVSCDQSPNFVWELVTKTVHNKNIWYDVESHLVWSEDLGISGISQTEYIKQCADITLSSEAKGNLDFNYRLPSRSDFELSISHGLRKVIPMIDGIESWTSTLVNNDSALIYFSGRFTPGKLTQVDEYLRARCVADY